MVWKNADGLTVYFPGDSRHVNGGEYPGAGEVRVIETTFALTGGSTSASTPDVHDAPWLIIPRNSFIEQVEVVADDAAASGTSVNVGLVRLDGTVEDADGLVAALVTASINVDGEKNVLTAGVTYAGDDIGTVTARPYHLCSYAAGTYDAGILTVRVKLRVIGPDTNKQY